MQAYATVYVASPLNPLSRRGDFVAPLRNFINVISFFYVTSPLNSQQRSDDLCQLIVLQKEAIVAELGCDFMVDCPGNA